MAGRATCAAPTSRPGPRRSTICSLAGAWVRIGVGDGGNEIGMGKLPAGLIAAHRAEWRAHRLHHLVRSSRGRGRVELGRLRPDGGARGAARRLVADVAKFLTAERDLAITRAIVEKAGAVDGVTARNEPTVDGFRPTIHAGADRGAPPHCLGAGGGLESPPWTLPPQNPYAPTHPEIRDAVRALCLKFDGAYWRKLDRERGYPTEFVKALTEAGWLSILIPEEYGGAGLGISAASGGAGGDPERRLQRRRLPRADVHHGHRAAARQRRAEGALPAQDRLAASCACRRSASPSRPAAPIR